MRHRHDLMARRAANGEEEKGSEKGGEEKGPEEEALVLTPTSRSSHVRVLKIASYGPVAAKERLAQRGALRRPGTG